MCSIFIISRYFYCSSFALFPGKPMFICSHKISCNISCNILLHLLPSLFICATLHLHQISGMIFSLCFNAHENPQPGFHFWISLLFQQRIHSDFWWCYSFIATLSAPALAQVACTPGKCYGTSEFLTNPFCIEFISIYCPFFSRGEYGNICWLANFKNTCIKVHQLSWSSTHIVHNLIDA